MCPLYLCHMPAVDCMGYITVSLFSNDLCPVFEIRMCPLSVRPCPEELIEQNFKVST